MHRYTPIPPHTYLDIKGTVVFSRLAKLIDGDSLTKWNAKLPFGMKRNVPFSMITISNPELVEPVNRLTPDQHLLYKALWEPFQGSKAKIFTSKSEPNTPKLTVEQKKRIPDIYHMDTDNKTITHAKITNELAVGVNVRLRVMVYSAGPGKGLRFEHLIITDKEIKYFQPQPKGIHIDGYTVVGSPMTFSKNSEPQNKHDPIIEHFDFNKFMGA